MRHFTNCRIAAASLVFLLRRTPTSGTMVPYRGVRYHLREWDRSHLRYVEILVQKGLITLCRPETPEELFNLRRCSARNVIEPIFGVVKARSKILERGCIFNIQLQTFVVLAFCALRNSIHEYAAKHLAIPQPFSSSQAIDTLREANYPQPRICNPHRKRRRSELVEQ